MGVSRKLFCFHTSLFGEGSGRSMNWMTEEEQLKIKREQVKLDDLSTKCIPKKMFPSASELFPSLDGDEDVDDVNVTQIDADGFEDEEEKPSDVFWDAIVG